ncbi:hypothetical protein MTO96_050313 [Rhipicephalus appendiculatus]
MSSEDIGKLCCIFYHLRFEELHSLDCARLPWLMPLRGHTLLPAVERIHSSIMSIEGAQERLNSTAKLYAWLVPRGVYEQWVLYRLHTSEAVLDASAVGARLVEILKSSGSCAAIGANDVGSSYSVAVLVVSEARCPPEYLPVCFCMWSGLPFLAYHAAEGSSYLPLLASVLRNMEKSLHGTYGDLSSAHIAATASKQF